MPPAATVRRKCRTCLSEPCLPEGITFTTQEQIDDFQSNYPGCTEIEGSVEITNDGLSEITSLAGLSVLTSIGGFLNIHNTSLTSLIGLEGLTSIGGFLALRYNNLLITIQGLGNLNQVDGNPSSLVMIPGAVIPN